MNNSSTINISQETSWNRQVPFSEGTNAVIYNDIENDSFLYKVLKSTSTVTKEELIDEVRYFNKYYGADSAKVINDRCIKILKLNGTKLRDLPIEIIRKNHKSFISMIEKMHDLDLIHGDFTMDNFLFDDDKKTFYPVDITNIRFNNNFIDTDILIANGMIEYLTRGSETQVNFKRQKPSELFNIKMTYITKL